MSGYQKIENSLLIEGNIIITGTIDDRDVGTDGISLDNHIAASSGIHGISGAVVGDSDSQILTNKTLDADNNTVLNIADAEIKASAAIDASKIADGSVNNTEYGFLNGVTSSIQTQLDGKAASSHTHTESEITDLDKFWIKTGSNIYYNSGTVAIGTDAPTTSRLKVLGFGAGDITPWLELDGGNGDDSGAIHYYFSGGTNAPAIKLRDLDDPPRIEFQQIGSGSTSSPQYDVWFGMDSGSSSNMRLEGGNFGIGKTPTQALDVLGNIAVSGTVDGRDIASDGSSLDSHLASSNQHIDHTSVSINAGVGLSGGGTIATTRTINLDINGLTVDATPDGGADYVVTYDASASGHKKVLLNNLPGGGSGGEPAKIGDFYDNAGDQTFTGQVVINIDTARKNTGEFSLNNDEITVNDSDTYLIVFRVSTEIASGNSRSCSSAWLEIDTGGGYSEVSGSRGYMYNRTRGNAANTCTIQLVLDISSGEKFRIKADRVSGNDTISTIINGSGITFVSVNSSGLMGPTGPSGPGGSGDVNGPGSSIDNYVPRFDGTSGKLLQGPVSGQVSYDDNGAMTISGSKSGYMLDIHNTLNSGGGKGFRILAGEVAGDIAFHIADEDDTFQIMELEADQGYCTFGKTYAQTLIDNGTVYGIDNQHSGTSECDFNTQAGVYRIAGTNVVDVAQSLTNKTITSTSNNVAAKSLHSATTVVDVASASAPSTGQVLTATSSTAATWQTPSSGTFGSNFYQVSSESESSTTSTSYQTKVTLNTGSLPSGTYRLGYTYEISNSYNGVLSEVLVELDGVTVSLTTFEADNDYHAFGGFVYQSLSGSKTARIRHRAQSSGWNTSLIRRARLELWRVS